MLIATAGHVDHGKTSLIQALTGVDTDRLPEEKKRGLTIDIGFAYKNINTGGGRLGFVDVPGHERFIRNMLAGVAAIDMVLLVIAADDGPMPQTREHLSIVSLLGTRRAAVALTKIDTVEAGRVAAVSAEINALLAATPMLGAPVFPVSAITGAGIGELDNYLQQQAQSLPQRTSSGYFRLAIDRSFSVAGAGLVVTGAIFSGSVESGDRLRLLPGGQEIRVREVHSQGQSAANAFSGERCALNISGPDVELANIHRGDWLVSSQQDLLTERVDVRLRVLPGEKNPFKHWTPVHVHSGSGSTTARVALLEDKTLPPGGEALVQLVLDNPALMVYRDHFVIRDQSAQRTMGGGYVIDPHGPKRGRAKPERIQLLQQLDTDDAESALQTLLENDPNGVDPDNFAKSRNFSERESQPLFERIDPVLLRSRLAISQPRWQHNQDLILNALKHWHEEHPDSIGPNVQQLRQQSDSGETFAIFTAIIEQLIRRAVIIREGVSLRLPDHRVKLSESDQALLDRVQQYLQPEQLKPPALKDLAAILELERDELGGFMDLSAKRGLIARVSASRYFHLAAVQRFAEICRQLAAQADDGLFDVRGFRDASEIGRNAAVEILEYFDRIGVTQRLGDRRRMHPNQ